MEVLSITVISADLATFTTVRLRPHGSLSLKGRVCALRLVEHDSIFHAVRARRARSSVTLASIRTPIPDSHPQAKANSRELVIPLAVLSEFPLRLQDSRTEDGGLAPLK